jgi:CRP-like cAMP-binding protein
VAQAFSLTSTLPPGREGSFWRRLNDIERAAFVEVGKQRGYKPGVTVIRAADTARWAVILLSGRVRITNGSQLVETRLAGEIVGEQRIIDKQPLGFTVRAETTVKALVVDGADLERLVGHLPRVLWVLCAVLSERLRGSHERLVSGAFTRVVRHLVRSAPDDDQAFTVPIGSQAALGVELDVSRDSVIRALRRLRAEEIVLTSRRLVTVRDPRRLRAYLTP